MSELPPLDQPNSYVVLGPEDQRGPYTMELLLSEVAAGHLQEGTPVWWPGVGDWTTFATHPATSAEISRRRAQMSSAGAPSQSDTPIEVDPSPADFEAVDHPVAEYDMTAAMGLDPVHGQTFADLVARSRARSEAAALVEQIDERFVEALTAAAAELGLTFNSHSLEGERHVLAFTRSEGREIEVSMTAVNGHLMAVDGAVELNVIERAKDFSGEPTSGTEEHGRIHL